MAENEKTEHYKIPKPHIENFISDDTPVLQMAFDIIDLLFREFAIELAKKMDGDADLSVADIDGLEEELANKMAKDRTFKLSEMTDVTGAENALDNYILTKSGAGFVLRSALAVIGIHTHDIANIVGLQAVLNTLAAGTSGVVDGEVTLFQGTGGKALKGSGVKLADLILSLDSKATSAQLTALSNAIADALDGKVSLEGNQTLTGGLILPWATVTDEDQPLYDNNVATKKYVDEKASKTYRQIYTTSGTWVKPSDFQDHDLFLIEAWGGGGGANNGRGGGGGGYASALVMYSALPSSVEVVIGAGGSGGATSGTSAGNGGNSSFGSILIAYGGGGCTSSASGAGGGNTEAANGSNPGAGGGSSNSGAPQSPNGGGGGGLNNRGAGSINGGGGGSNNGAGGVSINGGNGGSNGQPGVPPGGGAGSGNNPGARGEVRITKL